MDLLNKQNKIIEVSINAAFKALLFAYLLIFIMLGADIVKAAEQNSNEPTQVALMSNPVVVPAVKNQLDTVLAQIELNALLDNFVASYEDGNIENFISLFDRFVRTEDSMSRNTLRSQYNDLFSKTSSRLFMMHGIEWSKSNAKATGHGEFQVRVKPGNRAYAKTVKGKFTMEVQRKDGAVLITKLIYQPYK